MKQLRTHRAPLAYYTALILFFAALAPVSFARASASQNDAALYGDTIVICTAFGFTYLSAWEHDNSDADPLRPHKPHCPLCTLPQLLASAIMPSINFHLQENLTFSHSLPTVVASDIATQTDQQPPGRAPPLLSIT